MSKTIVILQSNYIPWKGYFDLMAAADEFLIFDEVQFTRRDWRNRNKIVVDGAMRWLSIPVQSKGLFEAPINEMQLVNSHWCRSHLETIRQAYRRSPGFASVAPVLEAAYREAAGLTLLTQVNELFLRRVGQLLGLETPLLRAEEAAPRVSPDPTGRLVEICRARGATRYLSGPAGRAYLDAGLFEAAGIALCFADYSGYRPYPQCLSTFEHGVSMLDVLFQCGPAAARDQLKSIADRDGLVASGSLP